MAASGSKVEHGAANAATNFRFPGQCDGPDKEELSMLDFIS
jgi:hypothetical protein